MFVVYLYTVSGACLIRHTFGLDLPDNKLPVAVCTFIEAVSSNFFSKLEL